MTQGFVPHSQEYGPVLKLYGSRFLLVTRRKPEYYPFGTSRLRGRRTGLLLAEEARHIAELFIAGRDQIFEGQFF